MIDADTFIYAFLGGLLPTLVWLVFWLREDSKHPEPRRLISKTFLFGMLAVLLVLPCQKAIDILMPGLGLTAILLWVLFEEIFKLGAAYFGGLRTVDDNEPIDPIIYMITAALGFAAMENTLFLLEPLIGEQVVLSDFFITGNLRFIGASLLHVVSSGIIGVLLAISFYRRETRRVRALILGIILASIFHTGFNVAIIKWNGLGTLIAFLAVWLGVIILLLAFEKAKTIAPRPQKDI